ncbi:MAG TPA: phospho-N-acetylmuramoyl-pentapeptide-transferase [Kiritimatiellia bacterium]|nr:phospho-N-acetylmuramoyl-pentapeptide-transferase [Kiritimatiellia bacterium]HMO99010.1 phospho-N-acetylmuramoyl-pentapeptide-transferase [Kiritimatiellia bacterium]HMP95897.1 phospho-N-acetylmuramoyl-pentapeptide-transferase [Kiritimatiellia bacterium]
MLYYLHELTEWIAPLRIFRYITFRALGGAATAFLLSLMIGKTMIGMLKALKIGQPVRILDSRTLFEMHGGKAGTPTMGGLLILATVTVSTLLWAIPSNGYVLITLATMLVMGGIGFWDDYLKVTKRNSKGLNARMKLAFQFLWGFIAVGFLYAWPESRAYVSQLMVPFLKDPVVQNLSVLGTLIFCSLVLTGATNAVNLTDGLDGLAIGCANAAAVAYLMLAYVAGNLVFASYLQVPYIAGTGELAVFCGCLLGAGMGFLWFNCHPAKVFMGDTGSLALGGAIAMVAICVKQELLLIIVGGVFVMEAMSVIIQVISFKLTGRRVFLCSPLHHHFEFKEKAKAEREGRDLEVVETMITTRFWILAMICALFGIATLKIR